ncbi:hypothetical protein CAPTEDRAFT_200002, partial [Capitella teleta]
IDECLADNGVAIDKDCHTCKNTQGSYICECDEGYEPYSNEKRCIDVDECEKDLYDAGCHTCVNLIGGHTCLCNETFVLDKSNNNEICIDLRAARARDCFHLPRGNQRILRGQKANVQLANTGGQKFAENKEPESKRIHHCQIATIWKAPILCIIY